MSDEEAGLRIFLTDISEIFLRHTPSACTGYFSLSSKTGKSNMLFEARIISVVRMP